MKHRVAADVSGLPTHGFGPRSTMWWGTLGFIALEGTAFVLAMAATLYIASGNPGWPAGAPPDLPAGSGLLLLLLLSLWPNIWTDRAAHAEDLRKVRIGLLVLSAVGVAAIGLRAWELTALNTRWDWNIYGSTLWLLIGLHTAHLITDLVDSLVLTVLMFTRHAHGKRFSDVSDNCFYWYFVIGSWVPIYALVYWGPRL